MFCGNLEDKNVENSVEDGSLTYTVSEGKLKTIRAIGYFDLKVCGFG